MALSSSSPRKVGSRALASVSASASAADNRRLFFSSKLYSFGLISPLYTFSPLPLRACVDSIDPRRRRKEEGREGSASAQKPGGGREGGGKRRKEGEEKALLLLVCTEWKRAKAREGGRGLLLLLLLLSCLPC